MVDHGAQDLEHPASGEGSSDALRSIIHRGAPMSPALLSRAMAAFGCDVINAFGAATEGGLRPCSARRTLDEGVEVDLETVRERCAGRLAASKVPEQVEVLPEMSLNGSGKILERRLREREPAPADVTAG